MTTSLSDEQIAGGGFYSVIPAPLLNDDRLSDAAVLLYALISQLTNANGECYASNAYLAKRRKCSERNIPRLVSQLETFGYIRCTVETRNKQRARIITLRGDKNVTPRQKCHDVMTNLSCRINKEKNINPPYNPPLPNETELLSEILSVHPRVEKPLPAQRAVISAANSLVKSGRCVTTAEGLAYLLEKVKLYAASPAAENVKFVPDACRWFNDACYDADPAVWVAGETRKPRDIFASRRVEDY